MGGAGGRRRGTAPRLRGGRRLYRSALALDPTLPDSERSRGSPRSVGPHYFAGDIDGCVDAAVLAADAARAAQSSELMGDAALVLEAVPAPGINTVAKQLCEEALAGLGDTADEALRARLLAQRSHLAFYDGEQDRTESLSAAALDLAAPVGRRARARRRGARAEGGVPGSRRSSGAEGPRDRDALARAAARTALAPRCGASCGGLRR